MKKDIDQSALDQNMTGEITTGSNNNVSPNMSKDIGETLDSGNAYNTVKNLLETIREFGFTKENYSNKEDYDYEQNNMIELINNLPEQGCDIKVFKSKLCEKFRESSLGWNSDWGHIIIRFRNILRTSAHTNPKVFFEKYHIDSTKLDTTKISFNNFEFQDSLDDDVLYNLLEHDIKGCGKMNNLSKGGSYSLTLYYKELLINAYEACIKG